jgi:hypothetical protein
MEERLRVLVWLDLAIGGRRPTSSAKVSAFEQTASEKSLTVALGFGNSRLEVPDWKLLSKLSATRDSKREILADVGIFNISPIVSSEF